ncbi:MAG: 50S ribosomal protein L22 [Flavisolibacter sp.]|nr:50S ribosomal protein L22 [Flavisolibacter sp.]
MEAVAKLKNYPTSPRKMRLLADLVRGMNVEKALAVLERNPKHPAVPLRKLVLSAISNWKQKNEGGDEAGLVIKTIFVDGARTLKRMRPAPQGRGYRVRKRSNHVTVIVDDVESIIASKQKKVKAEVPAVVEEPAAEETTTKKAAPKKSAAKKAAPKKAAAKKTTKE